MRKEGILTESASSTELLGALLAVLASTEEEMGVEASSADAFVANLYDEFRKGRCLLGTPLLTNIANGPERPLGSCSAAPIDPRGSKFDQERILERYYAQNMGTGMNLDAAIDPCSTVIRLNEHAAAFEGNGHCERYVGNIAHIDIDHPRILEFIELKSNVANLIHFNLSINVTESFQAALIGGGSWRLRDGTKISAPLLWDRIASCAWTCGDPGLIWLDRYNRQNSLNGICAYTTVAPCAEVGLSPGETCVFGYLNLAAFICQRDGKLEVDLDAIGSTTRLLVRALDAAITYSYRHQPTSVSSRQSFRARKIGVGVCGWSDLLLWLGMDYGGAVSDDLLSEILSVRQQIFHELAAPLVLSTRHGWPLTRRIFFHGTLWIQRPSNGSIG
jgi:ribonucleoside-diphosphate reductase alpha chain